MNREMPTMTAMNYASAVVNQNSFGGNGGGWEQHQNVGAQQSIGDQLRKLKHGQFLSTETKAKSNMTAARIVKVFVADQNENIPLDSRVIYRGDEHLTDLTDQELFFEIQMADLLKEHNEVRVKTRDKTQSAKFGRDIFLEPAKIRDLKMVVVTVATF